MPAASTDAAAATPRFDQSSGEALLHWYETERRDLPWRRTTDPYKILVSEIMLQQTRVDTVIPRYERFLARFPDLATLAAATPEDVLAEWSGLGYYRRARNLHAAARAIADEHDGEFPRQFDSLRALPGIGDYTAAAVAAIAFGAPHVGIDGNASRVLCRYFAISEAPTRVRVRRQLTTATESLLRHHPPGEVTQALIELGAMLCTPRSPRCTNCPLLPRCAAAAEGIQEQLPVRRKLEVVEVTEAAAVIERGGRFLMLRGQRPTVLADMWEFPTLDSRLQETAVAGSRDESSASLRGYLAGLGLRPAALHRLGEIRHGITNRRIVCTVFRAQTASAEISEPGERVGWFTPTEAVQLPLAASATRILALLADSPL